MRKISQKPVKLSDIESRLKQRAFSSKEIKEITSLISHNCKLKSRGAQTKQTVELRMKLAKAGYSDKEIDTIFAARKV
ncbi:hypothetical protein E4H12_11120 [Candidatus Thorarchaeota archaeon]|nr:MAG: hypothetical protein E4H12_11120 [Candidatus Thorarchaeota archaeon]